MSTDGQRQYTRDHIWIDAEGGIGVSAQLLAAVGRVARLHLPTIGDHLATATCFGSIELDKGVIDLFAPCDGAVVWLNDARLAEPTLIDTDTRLIRTDGRAGQLLSLEAYERYAAGLVFSGRRR